LSHDDFGRVDLCALDRSAAVRGCRGKQLDLKVSYLIGRKHLPIVELERAA
jgi:hypothetical protein